jgi:glycosyltransferase involved in cell wall biosynthesis
MDICCVDEFQHPVRLSPLAVILLATTWRSAGPIRLAGEPSADDAASTQGAEHLGLLSRDQVLEQMRAAAIYAAPALYEPFGLSILEAAMSGCALVLSDIPSLRELWGEAAAFADPRDPGAWIAVMRSLAETPTARTRLALAARARAQRYGVDRMGKAYLEAYEGLRSERQRSSHRRGAA